MNTVAQRKSTSIRLKRGLYEHLAERARRENRSFNNFVETILGDAVEYREPNEETKLAIEESRMEKPFLKGYTDMDELFADLSK